MKKILLFSTLVLMFSCSDESNIERATEMSSNASNVGAKSTSSFDDLFKRYIESPIYLELSSKTKLFTGKMKFTGNLTDINTRDKMLSWISANLSITEFTSISQAISNLEEIENLSMTDWSVNHDFYDQISDNKIRFSELLLIESMKNYTTSSGCKDQLNGCNSAAVDEYAGAMQGALDALKDGLIGSGSANNAMNNARAIYSINLTLCQEEYEACILR